MTLHDTAVADAATKGVEMDAMPYPQSVTPPQLRLTAATSVRMDYDQQRLRRVLTTGESVVLTYLRPRSTDYATGE